MRLFGNGLAFALISAAFAALLTGCGEKRSASSGSAPADQAARPAALNQAAEEIRAGQAAAAQARAQQWLSQNGSSPYRGEAHYLLGQSLFAQGKFESAKQSHDRAVDGAPDRTTKALAMLGRADCNYEMGKYHLASRQYHWLEEMYRDVSAVRQDEVLFKLGLCAKMAGFTETADYWFNRVIELYSTGDYAAEAKRQHSKLGPGKSGDPKYYSIEVASYADEKRALAEAEAFRAKGYRDVRVEPISMLGTQYHSVQIGRYENRNDAKRAKEDAELSGLSASIRPTWIQIPK